VRRGRRPRIPGAGGSVEQVFVVAVFVVTVPSVKGAVLAKFDPALYVREVRQEVARVTWPSRKETLITTGLVLGLSAVAAVFFLVVDQIIAFAMRMLFGVGG
jgi:preprotein translocase subunit SecE